MICFQNLYLWYSDTTPMNFCLQKLQLWFAFKIYIFDILIQQIKLVFACQGVVICFQNLYLWYSDTTLSSRRWQVTCCDLLSKFISLIFWYNFLRYLVHHIRVVICFQNLYLWYSDTTLNLNLKRNAQLWFAFKIYIFDILIQRYFPEQNLVSSCDLLSKFISLIFWYNQVLLEMLNFLVVICFQNLYLWYSDTTKFWNGSFRNRCDLLSKFISLIFWYNVLPRIIKFVLLWFAFKIYIFDILIQRKGFHYSRINSCDLLSKFISLIFWYNLSELQNDPDIVVICFQNLYLWYSDTT